MSALSRRRTSRQLAPVMVVLVLALTATAGGRSSVAEPIVPGRQWQHYPSPEAAGWSSARLGEAWDYAKTIKTAAVMVVADGLIVAERGETATRYNVHSIRKSLLSALYGIHVQDGEIDLSKTLADL